MRPRTKRLFSILAVFAITLLFIEAMLYNLDPMGIVTMRQDSNRLTELSTGSVDGWRLIPGQHRFRRYNVVVGIDGFRTVPETQVTDCRIAFIGDSVTYGFGSNTTFVNILAADLPNVTLHNWGVPGYGISNIAALMAFEPVMNGYIWLIYENDAEPRRRFAPKPPPLQPAILEYLSVRIIHSNPPPPDPAEGFTTVADELLARDDVLAFALNGRYLTDVIQARYPQVVIIPDYRDYSSPVDNHPSESGHAQLADSMRETVVEFTERIC